MQFVKALKEKLFRPYGSSGYMSTYTNYSPNYEEFVEQAYENPFFTAPINEIVRCFNLADIGVYDKKGNKVTRVDNHVVTKTLEQPNFELSQDQFQTYFLLYYLIGGGLLLYKTSGMLKKEMFLYSPDSFELKRDPQTFRLNSIKIGENPIGGLQLRNYKVVRAVNPKDKIAGLDEGFRSPLQSLVMQCDMVNYAFKHQNSQLQNSGKRTGLIEYKKLMSTEKKEELLKKFNAMGSGMTNAGRVALVNGENFKFHSMDLTPQEMDWLESMKFLRELIASVIGVPIQLISSEGTTYNNAREYKKKIYHDTIVPLLKMYCNTMTMFFKDDLQDNQYVWYDISKIDELKLDVTGTIKDLASGLLGQVTLNEFRDVVMDMTGLELNKLPADIGDRVLVQGNVSFIEDLIIDSSAKEDDTDGEET